ncbi:hypothetical protein [Dendronalium sp. ChiSLP03b]|nr:hypothetical protein [Dendronalium sp. ChiSLP03b]MDZ8203340.1 hypothetical protein [Dendronalium sp. ChiSLP03b]
MERHQGKLECHSTLEGTELIVMIPQWWAQEAKGVPSSSHK